MDLTIGLALGAVPVTLLGASVLLANAYNRLRARYERACFRTQLHHALGSRDTRASQSL